jgi:hypothetical protein
MGMAAQAGFIRKRLVAHVHKEQVAIFLRVFIR